MKNTSLGHDRLEVLDTLIDSLLSTTGSGIFVVDTSAILSIPFNLEENISDMELAETNALYYQKITPWICDPKRILTKGSKGEIQKILMFDRIKNNGKKGFEKYNAEAGNLHRRLISKAVYYSKDNEKHFFEKIEEYGRKENTNLRYVSGCSGEDKSSIITVLEMVSGGIKTGLASQDFKQLILMEEMARYLKLPVDIVSYSVPDKKYGLRSV